MVALSSTSATPGTGAAARLALVFGSCLFVVAVYWQSYASMWSLWQQADHSHGLLIFPIFAFLLWRCRFALAAASTKPNIAALQAVFLLVATWVVARLTAVQVVEHFAALALIPVCILAVFGRELAAQIAFPLVFIGFALPVSDALVPVLMQITADISTFLLRLTGTPVYREGQYLTLSGGSFVVADVCSGVRYLMAGLIITSLFAYTYLRSTKEQILFVAISGIVMILANGVRAFLVMAIASASEMKYLGGKDHIFFGWLLFAVVIFVMMWLASRYAQQAPDSRDGVIVAESKQANSRNALLLAGMLVAGMLVITIKPMLGEYGFWSSLLAIAILLAAAAFMLSILGARGPAASGSDPNDRGISFAQFGPPAVVILAMLAGPNLADRAVAAPNGVQGELVIAGVPGCQGPNDWREEWRPVMSNAARQAMASFSCGRAELSVFVAAYANPSPNAELISSVNRLYPASWDRYGDRFERQRIGGGQAGDALARSIDLPTGERVRPPGRRPHRPLPPQPVGGPAAVEEVAVQLVLPRPPVRAVAHGGSTGARQPSAYA